MLIVIKGYCLSGKTAAIIEYEKLFTEKNKNCLIFVPHYLQNTNNGILKSRNGSESIKPAAYIEELDEFGPLKEYDVVLIDNADPFDNLPFFTEKWISDGKTVVLTGNPDNENIIDTLPQADKVITLVSKCEMCV